MARQKMCAERRSAPRPGVVAETEQRAIVAACDAFIRDVLKPRFLPEIRVTTWNYPIDIRGAWAGGRYRFIRRCQIGAENGGGGEFDAPFARFDRAGSDRFDIYWMRQTGTWWNLYRGVTLVRALEILEMDGVLHPH